jgi:4-amino-4-deoxy-L-arabinose transferase-like glycosyltransferase
MPAASFSFAKSRDYTSSQVRRASAWLAACASDPRASLRLVIGFAIVHAALWTLILVNLKAAQDVHFDVAEAYAWGQKFLLGYGKHPPLSGWIAGVWFKVLPATNWSTYALAMAVLGVALLVCWQIALRVVDRRRAFLTVVMLALYPIFNFKGFKYNPDLLQLVTLPLVVLAYLDAFEKRTLRSGVWLGLACALALLTKYWALTVIGAVGIAALAHPDRILFLRSPAPWVAIGALMIAMAPHLVWLAQVDFLPLTFATETYVMPNGAHRFKFVAGYIEHNFALLVLPLVIAALVLAWAPRWWWVLLRSPAALFSSPWSQRNNPGVRRSQALNIWIVQAVVAIGPPIGGVVFAVYMKTDWGIPLFFMVPLALVAMPALRVQKIALFHIVMVWFVATATVLVTSPYVARVIMDVNGPGGYTAKSELAHELTQAWHTRFGSRWAIVAASTQVGEPMTFYSTDHPAPFTPGQVWASGLTSFDEAKRLGFIGICDNGNYRIKSCMAWMEANAAGAERLAITTQRFFHGRAGAAMNWKIYIVPPAK